MRRSWNDYFMAIAHEVATRATCDRKHVGCVIVDNTRNILSTGYNGSIRGQPHCDDEGHDMDHGHCVRTVHAEANAIAQAAARGARLEGSTLYVTAHPCWPCYKLIANAGIRKVIYGEAYRPDPRIERAQERHHTAPVVFWIESLAIAEYERGFAYDWFFSETTDATKRDLAHYARCRELFPDFEVGAVPIGAVPTLLGIGDSTFAGGTVLRWCATRAGLGYGQSTTFDRNASYDVLRQALSELLQTAHAALAAVVRAR